MIAILDIDGTLVDTNYHHALAWYRALRSHGCTVPLWRLHRHMGMGGDQLVASVAGDDFEAEHGDDVRAEEKERYGELIDEVAGLEGATELIKELQSRGCDVILASSAKEEEVEHYVSLLGTEGCPYTTSADVEATKPQPDLILAALEKMDGDAADAVLIGDSVWDCEAAERAGVRTVGLLTGGFSEDELRGAGAVAVFASIADLLEDLDEVLAKAPASSS